jgi:NAD(P)-dependent dehydrogenase (short-subunit alcohol dehydrogenase family)
MSGSVEYASSVDLRGRVAIVTGSGGGGCGRAVARRFAQDGAFVVVSDVDERGGQETVRLIHGDGGQAAFLRADIATEAQIQALVEFAEATCGGLDILVNNASAPYPPQTLLEHWFDALEVDLLGAIKATAHAIRAMRKRGGGAIVNVGSTSALGHGRKHSKSPCYDVAKMGLMRFTTTLAPLRERERIRVNCIVPDWVSSPEVNASVDSLAREQRKDGNVPEVLTTPEEIADAVVQLATDEARAGRIMVWFNGQPRRLIPEGDPGYAGLE